MVYLAEAYYDENHKTGYEGTKPGDQIQSVPEGSRDKNGEVRVSDWRDMNATMIARYKDKDLAKAHSEAAVFFANSKKVGYSQPNRLSLKNYIKSIGYSNYKKLDRDKECDCSSLQCLCCNLVGLTEVKDWNTTAMLANFPKLTKYFIIIYRNQKDYDRDKKNKVFTPSDDVIVDSSVFTDKSKLLDGDILIRDGHTASAAVIEDPKPEVVKPESKDIALAGNYKATTSVNLRYGPSSSKYEVETVLSEGQIVGCDGSYTNDWYYVTTSDNIKGYVKKDYLVLVESFDKNEDKDNNGKIDSLASPTSYKSFLAGKYKTTTDVNLRYGPSSSKYDVICVVKQNETVTNYGYCSDDWYYVRTSKGTRGYIKSRYLKKKV